MRFSPAPPAERGQLRIFSGTRDADAAFETAFVRLSPSDYRAAGRRREPDRGAARRRVRRAARRTCSRASRPSRSASTCEDLSRDDVAPAAADRRLPRRGATPAASTRSPSRARRRRPRTSACSSARTGGRSRCIRRRPSWPRAGASTATTRSRDYDVLDYNVDVVGRCRSGSSSRAAPGWRSASARTSLSTLTLRLADALDGDAA